MNCIALSLSIFNLLQYCMYNTILEANSHCLFSFGKHYLHFTKAIFVFLSCTIVITLLGKVMVHYFVSLLWPPYVIGQSIIFLPSGFFYFSSFFLFVSSPNFSCRRLDLCMPYFQTWCGLSANLRCRSEMCFTWLAEYTGCKKLATLSGYIFACQAHINSREKNLLNSNISPTCRYNMVNFGLLVAEIVSLVWGTPANFNGFHVLEALLHGTLVVGVSETLWR